MDVTVRSRTAPVVPPVTPSVPQAQPVEAEAPAPAPAAPAVPTPPVIPETPAAPEAPKAPDPIPPAPSPEPPASIDVHEAPQYEDESEKPAALQTADHPNDASVMHPEQAEKPAEEPKPAQAEVRQQPKPKNASTTPVGAIVATLFVMAVLAGLTVMVYLQS